MRLIQIALGNVDATVGAVRANGDRLVSMAKEMAKGGATVGCFPEQAIGGYPPEDLVQWRAFVASRAREKWCRAPVGVWSTRAISGVDDRRRAATLRLRPGQTTARRCAR